LATLAGHYPRRITGSTALDHALTWAAARMREDGLDDVRLEPVTVPHWVRGSGRARDGLDAIRPEDLRRNAGAVALLAWVLAER
jgi:hypothetical protein